MSMLVGEAAKKRKTESKLKTPLSKRKSRLDDYRKRQRIRESVWKTGTSAAAADGSTFSIV